MLTRLDAILVAAWVTSGSLALENHQRIDMAQPDQPAVKVAAVDCQAVPRQRWSGYLDAAVDVPIDATMLDITIVCTPRPDADPS